MSKSTLSSLPVVPFFLGVCMTLLFMLILLSATPSNLRGGEGGVTASYEQVPFVWDPEQDLEGPTGVYEVWPGDEETLWTGGPLGPGHTSGTDPVVDVPTVADVEFDADACELQMAFAVEPVYLSGCTDAFCPGEELTEEFDIHTEVTVDGDAAFFTDAGALSFAEEGESATFTEVVDGGAIIATVTNDDDQITVDLDYMQDGGTATVDMGTDYSFDVPDTDCFFEGAVSDPVEEVDLGSVTDYEEYHSTFYMLTPQGLVVPVYAPLTVDEDCSVEFLDTFPSPQEGEEGEATYSFLGVHDVDVDVEPVSVGFLQVDYDFGDLEQTFFVPTDCRQ